MMHLVNFCGFCYKCVHADKADTTYPCCECISIAAREGSERPEHYVENEKYVPADTFGKAVEKWRKDNLVVKEKKHD